MIILDVDTCSFVNKVINYIRTASFFSCQVQGSHLRSKKRKITIRVCQLNSVQGSEQIILMVDLKWPLTPYSDIEDFVGTTYQKLLSAGNPKMYMHMH